MLRRAPLVALALAPLAIGCSSFPTYAEHGVESLDTVAVEAMFIVAGMDGMTPSTTPTEAASNAASQAGVFFGAGCFTTSIDGPAVTYELVDCTGPFGLSGITGTVTTTYRNDGMGVGFDVVAGSLTVGGTAARFTVAAEVSNDVTRASVMSMAEIVGPRGILVGRDGPYAMRYGASTRCAAIDGTFTTTVETTMWQTTVTEWQICPTRCARGTIALSGDAGSVTITSDGTPTASWDAGGDGTGTIPLICPQ